MNMKMKRILIGFLTAFMLLALVSVFSVPLVSKAAPTGPVEHKGHDTDGSYHEGWKKLSTAEDLINLGKTGGTGYLTCDIMITKMIKIEQNKQVNLCLNGYNIYGFYSERYDLIRIAENGVLYLYDESDNTGSIMHTGTSCASTIAVSGKLYMYGGRISGGKPGVRVSSTGTFVMEGGEISLNDGAQYGGGVSTSGDFTMNGGLIDENNSSYHGGGVYVGETGTFTLNNGTISGNNAASGGGVCTHTNGTFIMNGGNISKNTANQGGGIFSYGGSAIINDGKITGNEAQMGGGIHCGYWGVEAFMTINKATISGNKAIDGGGICVYGTLELKEGDITKNTAEYGGGMYFSKGADFTMSGGNISKNTADYGGGLCLADEGNISINKGKINNNTANKDGGGVYLDNASYRTEIHVNGGEISGNSAKENGGGIYTKGDAFVSGGKISSNSAPKGGGIYINEGFLTLAQEASVTGNKADLGGGAYCYSQYNSCFEVEGSSFTNNSAKEKGNGVYVDGGGVIDGKISESVAKSDKTGSVKFMPEKSSSDIVTQYYAHYYFITFTPNRFTRSGFKFHSWNTKADGKGDSYSDQQETYIEKDLVLYAQWKPKKYTVKFDPNGGTGTMSSQSIGYNVSATLTANSFKYTGYTFKGWNTKADGSGTSYSDKQTVKFKTLNVNKITLYAQWQKNKASYKVEHYKQKLDGTYGKTASETETFKGKVNSKVTPEVKSYKGFTAPETKTAKVKEDGSLVVKYYYTRNSYKLTWDFAGGSAKGSYTKGSVKYAAKITAPVPVRDGYEFTGWDKTVASKMPAKDVTYKATWRKLTKKEQVTAFVERFYTIILERPAEADGLADWTNRLIGKTATGADVAAGFINSGEFQKKKMTDEEYVTKLYRAFFDREPDKDGYNSWLRELKNGKTRDDVLRGFINSPEFNNLCKKYGINTGSY